ncbi:MAG: branched-chain amino acid ABC transporter permease [Thermoprotei archaeon]|nr:MAG: branched-chain amino acid ABC transporter permease [Thermoprotei archaeon]
MYEVLVDALAYSDILVLLSIGITLTYMTVKVPNFAHGDYASIGAYIAFTLNLLYGIDPFLSLPLAFLVSGLISLALYLFVFKPLSERGANIVTLMVASIAIELILRSIINIYADVMTLSTKVPIFRGFIFSDTIVNIGNIAVPLSTLVATITAILVVVGLHLFLTKTRFGIAMRASIENPDLAKVLGINVDLVYSVSWFIAGGLAGIVGIFIPFRITANPQIGWDLLLRGFSSSVVGGLTSIYGAIIGGLFIGTAEIIGIYFLSRPPFYLSTAFRPSIPFLTLIITLLIIPKGITGIDFNGILRRKKGEEDGNN